MSALALSTQMSICAICRDVFRSPRFLPCHHSFCLECLEQLSNVHGDVIPCPTCRDRARIPPGGVRALQVNFYFTDEALEQARGEGSHSMCPVHTKECVIFNCTQCNQAICMLCKLTKHQSHVTEDLSEAVVRSKKTIEDELNRLDKSIKRKFDDLEILKQSQKQAREKRDGIAGQLQRRYDAIVAMAERYRHHALQQLDEISGDIEKHFAADTQRVQDKLNSLLQLQDRGQRALSSTCDTEVLEVERDLRREEGNLEWLRKLESALPNTSYRPGLHGDFTNDIEDYIKKYIGSPVKLSFATKGNINAVRVGWCGDKECCEVHSFRQKDDTSIDIFYGGTGGDFRKEKNVLLMNDGSRTDVECGMRKSCVTRKSFHCLWENQNPTCRSLGSKDESMYVIIQNCSTSICDISSIELRHNNGQEECAIGTTWMHPKVQKIHNFDSNRQGSFFAVVDEDEDDNSSNETEGRNGEQMFKCCPRVVRVFSKRSNYPIATYTSPMQPFFPTDVCFSGTSLLLIADWMNDCVHVAKVTNTDVSFVDYLPGCGDIVRPTALNLDLNGQLLIGCGDGWVFRNPVEICSMYKTVAEKRNSQGLFVAPHPKRKKRK